ncbi:MAG: hypothetical protein ACP5N5_02080 [Desulfurococcus sp.]
MSPVVSARSFRKSASTLRKPGLDAVSRRRSIKAVFDGKLSST